MLLENSAERLGTMGDGGDRLAGLLRRALEDTGLPGIVQNVGPMIQLHFLNPEGVAAGVEVLKDFRDFCRYVDRDRFRAFAHHMFDEGVYLSPSASLHSIVSSVTTTDDIQRAGAAAHAALARLAESA